MSFVCLFYKLVINDGLRKLFVIFRTRFFPKNDLSILSLPAVAPIIIRFSFTPDFSILPGVTFH